MSINDLSAGSGVAFNDWLYRLLLNVSTAPYTVLFNSGNFVLPSTSFAWTDIESSGAASARPGDVVVSNVRAGDTIEVFALGSWADGTTPAALGAYTIVDGTATNPVWPGLFGVTSWGARATTNAQVENISGSVFYVVEEEDIVDGTVRFRLRYSSNAERTLNATSSAPLLFGARGPFG